MSTELPEERDIPLHLRRVTLHHTSCNRNWLEDGVNHIAEVTPLYDGSGRREQYPDGVIRTKEQANAIANRLQLCWNAFVGYSEADIETMTKVLAKELRERK